MTSSLLRFLGLASYCAFFVLLITMSLRPFRAELIYPVEKTVLRENLVAKIPAKNNIASLMKAVAIVPDDIRYLSLLGKYYLYGDEATEEPVPQKPNLKKAAHYFKSALSANPTYTEAISYLGWIDFAMGQPMKGLQRLDSVIRISGHNYFHRIMFFRAVAQFGHKLPLYIKNIVIARAETERLEALRLNPALRNHPWARMP